MALQRQLAVEESVPVITRLCVVALRRGYLASHTVLQSASPLRVQVPMIDELDGAEGLRVVQTDSGSEAGHTTNAGEPLAAWPDATAGVRGDPVRTYLHEISQMPLLTAEQEDVISKVKRTAHALQQAHQREPTVEEIADAQMSAHGSENPSTRGREGAMNEQTQHYSEIRGVLEELVASYPLDYPIDSYVAACYYLSEHCEECGARLHDKTLSFENERGQTLPDMADACGGDSTICTGCLARRRQAVV